MNFKQTAIVALTFLSSFGSPAIASAASGPGDDNKAPTNQPKNEAPSIREIAAMAGASLEQIQFIEKFENKCDAQNVPQENRLKILAAAVFKQHDKAVKKYADLMGNGKQSSDAEWGEKVAEMNSINGEIQTAKMIFQGITGKSFKQACKETDPTTTTVSAEVYMSNLTKTENKLANSLGKTPAADIHMYNKFTLAKNDIATGESKQYAISIVPGVTIQKAVNAGEKTTVASNQR